MSPPEAPPSAPYSRSVGRDPGRLKLGIILIVAGCVPMAAGSVMATTDGLNKLPGVCPMQTLFGLPCPLCGASRAFVLASSGDLRFLSYNAYWVFVALAMALIGVMLISTRLDLTGLWARLTSRPQYPLLVLFVGGWIWALVNRGTIVTG